jgi:hypothetical protein
VELDNSSGSVNEQAITDNSNPSLDKGNTNINRPNIFVMNEVFYLPKLANQNQFVRGTLGGWEVNSILNVSSGASLSVFSSGASGYGTCTAADVTAGTCVSGSSALNSTQGSGYTNNNRPDVVPHVSCNGGENGRQILNQNAFTFVGYAIGSDGTAGRGICSGAAYRDMDMQFAKNWYFKEHYRIKFAVDFFNLFNHANWGSVENANFNANGLICGSATAGVYAPCSATNNVVSKIAGSPNQSFGQATSVQPGRELQYSLRFYF